MIVDLFLVYQFIRRLVTPFTEWEAYKLGIIDDKGNILIKKKNFTKLEQSRAFGVFDRLVLNLKKLLAKVPGGSSKIASYAAALWLIKEHNYFTNKSMLTEETTDEEIEKLLEEFDHRWLNYIISEANVNSKFEEVPANNVGGGAIAGLGVGAQGEPGLTPDQQKRYKKKNFKQFVTMIKREGIK